MLQDWIGGGSADNFVSPLGTRLETLVSKWDAEDMQTLPKRKESSYIYTDV